MITDWVKLFRLEDDRQALVTLDETDAGKPGIIISWMVDKESKATIEVAFPNYDLAESALRSTLESGVRRVIELYEQGEWEGAQHAPE
jgi:hypothetical protein